MFPGIQVKEISEAIAQAFDEDELKRAIKTEMDVRLDRVVGRGPLDAVVFDLLTWAERQGREVELIRAVYRANPRAPQVHAVYQKYGMATPVLLQRQGASSDAYPQAAGVTGFEKTIKQYLPILDVGLWREQLARAEGRVCRVELNDSNNAMGTGFLVGPDVVLTNYHVLKPAIDDRALAAKVRFRFDFKMLPDGTTADGVVAGLHATDWLVDYSPYSEAEAKGDPDNPPPTADELDYALVRLERPIGQEPVNPAAPDGVRRGWMRIPDVQPALEDQSLFILQHPRRAPLKLALDTQAGAVMIHDGRRMRYATTTDEGSSGSPCFNSRWVLLALHHYGDPGFVKPAKYNQGVPIAAIRERVAKRGHAATLGGDPP